ncbi:MAG: CPBP family intramembrane metalloprotease [Candidatus Lokiarchaeota archaeon]|nr:CPBP family intramembrane metalloprotease [Candidatus Lokiarchaeota archaeon]
MDQNRKKEIALDRFRFFLHEVALGFILIFVCLLIPAFLIPSLVGQGSPLYGILFYSLKAIFVFIGVPLILTISNLVFESQKRNVIIEEDISPSKGHLKLYKMSKKNYKYQILYGLLIFFLIFLPIDFFGYVLIPEMLEYQSYALPDTDFYLQSGTSYILFLVSVIIIQFSVAISEETISRGLLVKRGSEHFFSMSAVMISALYWGFGHFAYFLDPISRLYSIWYPFIWFLQAFIIGIVLSLFVLKKKWIFPVIIAHTLNNIITAHAIWSFNNAIDFSVVALYLYCPLLIIGCVLFIWQFTQIKKSLSIGFKMLISYFKRDNLNEDTKGDLIFRVFIDILMGLIIFIMGFMIMI